MSEEGKIDRKWLEAFAKEEHKYYWGKQIKLLLEENDKQQKEIKKLKERIKGAIRFLEGCKTDSGTYVLFLSETEYLSEILKGE